MTSSLFVAISQTRATSTSSSNQFAFFCTWRARSHCRTSSTSAPPPQRTACSGLGTPTRIRYAQAAVGVVLSCSQLTLDRGTQITDEEIKEFIKSSGQSALHPVSLRAHPPYLGPPLTTAPDVFGPNGHRPTDERGRPGAPRAWGAGAPRRRRLGLPRPGLWPPVRRRDRRCGEGGGPNQGGERRRLV